MDIPTPSAGNDPTKYALLDILDPNDLQQLQDSFAKANRVASTIVDLDGAPLTRPSHHSQVCTLIRQTAKGLENCRRSGKALGALALSAQQPYCHFCQSVGFMDAAAPIVIEGVHVANWLIGQNCVGEVDEQRILDYAEEIGTDRQQLLAAFRKMDKMAEGEFRAKLDFLWLMANQISNQAYQHVRHQTMLRSLERSQRELSRYKDNLEQLVNQRTSELEQAIEQIQQISMRDALTGCYNRGGINKYLPREVKRAKRYNQPISLLLCDLDHFKRINDSYGHQSGDLVLKETVARMQQLIRDDVDLLARYGGEEFLLVMPHTPAAGAKKTAERLRQAIAALEFHFAGKTIHITASFGVVSVEDWRQLETIFHEDLLNQADKLLYHAKEAGRNRAMAAPAVAEPG